MAGVVQSSSLPLVAAAIAAVALGAALVFLRPPPARGPSPGAASASASSPALEPRPLDAVPVREPSASPPAAPEPPPSAPETCPAGMVLVEGWRCPFVAHRCREPRANLPGDPPTCLRYAPEVLCEGTYLFERFCVDAYEYPNQPGVLPAVLVDFEDAERACELEQKQLCTAAQWSFACEGAAILPYSTGLERDAAACRLDAGTEGRVVPTRGPTVPEGLARVDARVPAGALGRCQSPFGVRDLTGNVAEWTREPTGGRKREPFVSVVAGSGWGQGPGHCRALDARHAPTHRAPSLGFRCCSEAAPRRGEPPPAPRRRGGFQPIDATRHPGLP